MTYHCCCFDINEEDITNEHLEANSLRYTISIYQKMTCKSIIIITAYFSGTKKILDLNLYKKTSLTISEKAVLILLLF